MRQSVAAILISTEGEIILQERDNNPGIAQPGKVNNLGVVWKLAKNHSTQSSEK